MLYRRVGSGWACACNGGCVDGVSRGHVNVVHVIIAHKLQAQIIGHLALEGTQHRRGRSLARGESVRGDLQFCVRRRS